MAIGRVAWLLAGVAWAARSMLDLAHPDYWDPVTPLDWTAVWLYSGALLLLAPAVVLLGGLASSQRVLIAASVVAIAATVAGIANAVEDGLGADGWGTPYVVGFMTAWVGLLALAVTLRQARHSRLAGIVVGLIFGVMLITLGGGVIVLVALGSLAVAPRWFTARDTQPVPRVTEGSVG